MSLLDSDAKVLKKNASDEKTSVESKAMSNRTAGGLGLRRFGNINNFNANIKKKKAIQADVSQTSEVIAEVQVNVVGESKPAQVEEVTIVSPAVAKEDVIQPEVVVEVTINQAALVADETPSQQSVPIEAATPQINTPVEILKAQAELPPKKKFEPVVKASNAVQSALASITANKNTVIQSVTQNVDSQLPQTEVVNTPKAAPVAKTEVFETPQPRGKSETLMPHRTPQNKVSNEVVQNHNLPKTLPINHFKGNALFLMKFFFEEMVKNGGSATRRLTLSEISLLSGVNYKTTDRLLSQFVREGDVILVESKKGNGGYRTLALNQNVFNLMIKFTSGQTPHQIPQLRTSSIDSSINVNYTRTANEVIQTHQRNFNFKELDFSAVAPFNQMQVNSGIRKLAEERLEREEMQLFVDRFPVWIATQKNVTSPLGIFCSQIKALAEEGDSPVMYVLSKKEVLAEREFHKNAEALMKQTEMAEKYRNEVVSIDVEAKFDEWVVTLSDEQKLTIVPEMNAHSRLGSQGHNHLLRAYFRDNIYQQNM